MRPSVRGVGVLTFVICLALPGLIFAQEPPPVGGVPAEGAPAQEPAEPPPPAEPAAADPGAEPAQPSAATPVAAAEPASASVAVSKASASVSMTDNAFSPATVTINVGDSVTWVNNGEVDHDAAGSGFATTSPIPPGQSDSVTFSSAGTFSYICNFHPSEMKGTVVVDDQGGTNGGTDQGGETGVDPRTGVPLGSEAAAGSSPDAAGTGDALPASGEAEAPLVILGTGFVACGLVAAALARARRREIYRG